MDSIMKFDCGSTTYAITMSSHTTKCQSGSNRSSLTVMFLLWEVLRLKHLATWFSFQLLLLLCSYEHDIPCLVDEDDMYTCTRPLRGSNTYVIPHLMVWYGKRVLVHCKINNDIPTSRDQTNTLMLGTITWRPYDILLN